MKCLALELAPKGIVVNAVVGGPERADGSHQGAAAVGGAVRYLLEEAGYLAAQTIDVSNER
jgi:NAD(P)-dependent dehydrogenase (short-subunit alcohol dehydrogenase family)